MIWINLTLAISNATLALWSHSVQFPAFITWINVLAAVLNFTVVMLRLLQVHL